MLWMLTESGTLVNIEKASGIAATNTGIVYSYEAGEAQFELFKSPNEQEAKNRIQDIKRWIETQGGKPGGKVYICPTYKKKEE
jgi:hypothetical protein